MVWEAKFDHEEARRMRATGQYTVQQIADHFGVTKGAISHVTSDVAVDADPALKARKAKTPETATEMLELALPELWVAFKGSKGIAKKHAFEAIAAAAKREQASGVEALEPDPLIADVVSGVASLAPERRQEILSAERSRLVDELEAIERVLAEAAELVPAGV